MNRGHSESFSKAPATSSDSPFAIVPDAEIDAPTGPFAWVAREQWPFKGDDAAEGFGFDAPPSAQAPQQPQAASGSPFAAFAAPAPSRESVREPALKIDEPAFQPFEPQAPKEVRSEIASPAVPAAFTAAPAAVSRVEVAEAVAADGSSDSSSIRQLELKAIFGLDREINSHELLALCGALPRVRNVARIRAEDVVTIEALKSLMTNLGFGTGALTLQIGSAPLDFIREGKVILAVQTDGGFAPGVRETLMIAAREMGRMS